MGMNAGDRKWNEADITECMSSLNAHVNFLEGEGDEGQKAFLALEASIPGDDSAMKATLKDVNDQLDGVRDDSMRADKGLSTALDNALASAQGADRTASNNFGGN